MTDYPNLIVQLDNGQYMVQNGNAESVERYDTYEDAHDASEADNIAYGPGIEHEEAENNSPITWC